MEDWKEIVRKHGPSAYRTAWRILGHEQDCEDVMQNVFVEAYPLYVRGQVKHWRTFLNRMVTFRALDALRQRQPLNTLDESSLTEASLTEASAAPDQPVINREEEQRLRAIVARLPQRQAAVFCLAHFEGLSNSEVAESLEISLNAVGMALHKARSQLRKMFAQPTSLPNTESTKGRVI